MVTNREQLREEAKKRLSISSYLQSSLKKVGNKHYTNCPLHNDSTPSAVVLPAKAGMDEMLYCHSCRQSLDVIGVVRACENCSEDEALRKILGGEASCSVASCAAQAGNKKKSQQILQTFKEFNELNQQEKGRVCRYFYDRAITPTVALNALAKSGIRAGMVFKGKYNQIAFITDDMSIVIRWDDAEKRNRKLNYGGNRPLPLIINNSKEIYITEGLEDGLSLSMLGLNSISINGVGNVEKGLELIVERFQPMNEYKIIIALDNDGAGIAGAKGLKQSLLNLGYKVGAITNHFRAGKKDINELLQAGLLNKSNLNIKYFN